MRTRSFNLILRPLFLGIVGVAGILSIIASGHGGGGGSSTTGSGTTTSIYPRYAFVANRGEGSVSTYVVDAATGRLKWISKAAAGTGAFSVAADPSGKYAYVANSGTTTVSQYTIGANGGLMPGNLTSMGVATVPAGNNPQSVVVDPSGKYAYVANFGSGSVSAYTISSSTGALSQISCGIGFVCSGANFTAGNGPYAIAVDPAGKYVYVANYTDGTVSQFAIGPTGALTAIAVAASAGPGSASVTVDPSGKYIYVANSTDVPTGSVSAYTINATTGALSSIPCAGPGVVCVGTNFAAGGGAASTAIDPSGKYLYVGNSGGSDNSVSQFSIGTTGALTSIATAIAAGTAPYAVAVDPSGKYVYVANANSDSVSQYSIGGTGALTALNPGSSVGRSGPVGIIVLGGTAVVQGVPKYAYTANSTTGNLFQYTIGTSGALTSNGTATGSGAGLNFVTTDPSGSYAYVTNVNNDSVSAYGINVSTGVLNQINCTSGCAGVSVDFQTGTAPSAVAVNPASRYVYVANGTSNSVSAYTIATGALARINCSSGCVGSDFAAGTGPSAVTVDPTGQFVYVANATSNSVSAFGVSIMNGSLARITCSAGCVGFDFATGSSVSSPSSVMVDPSGKYAYVTNKNDASVSAFSINASTGALTKISCSAGCVGSDFATGSNASSPSSVTVDPSGKYAYVANSTDASISAFSINASTGALTKITCSTGCSGSDFATGATPSSVTVDSSGIYLYVANNSDDNVSEFRIGANGALSTIATASSGAGSGPKSVVTTGTWQ